MARDEEKGRTPTPEAHPMRREADKWGTWDKRIRDLFIFVLGIVGAVNELFVVVEPRPYALVFIASMIGIPFVLRADERRGKM